jgi:hypothetical protein
MGVNMSKLVTTGFDEFVTDRNSITYSLYRTKKVKTVLRQCHNYAPYGGGVVVTGDKG